MQALVMLAVLLVAGLLWLLRGGGGSDAPARIVTVAAALLPEHRRDWGRAMAAELAQIHGRGRRWRFAVGAVRVALLPPPRRRNRVLAVALAGLAAAAGATVAAASEVPGLSVFAAVLGLLLCGYATAVTSRSPRPRPTVPRVIVGVTAVAGAAAAVAVVARIAAAHPAATTDDTHVFSILFALTLAGYLALGLTPPRLGDHPDTVLWWALAATLASAAGWAAAVLATPAATAGVIGYLSPAGVAAALAASPERPPSRTTGRPVRGLGCSRWCSAPRPAPACAGSPPGAPHPPPPDRRLPGGSDRGLRCGARQPHRSAAAAPAARVRGGVRSAPAGTVPGPRACCWQSCGRWRSPGSARPASAWPGRRRPRTARRARAGAPPSP